MSNRVITAIERCETKLRTQFADGVGLNGKPIDSLHEGMALSFADFTGYQGAQSRAYASGKLTADEANTIYQALGGDVFAGDWPESTSLAVKLVVTQVVGELLGVPTPA